jgi:hypothetical protein
MDECTSTHGGSGYAGGTYVNEVGDVVCGCGEVIAHVDPGSRQPWGLFPPSVPLLPLPDWVKDERPIEEQGR